MKKLLSSFVLLLAGMTISAEVIVSDTEDFSAQAESMSSNAQYVAGSDQAGDFPIIWDVTTGEISYFYKEENVPYLDPVYGTYAGWDYEYNWMTGEIIDSVWNDNIVDYDNILGYDTAYMPDVYKGTFHAINNSGLAVGTFGPSMGAQYPAMAHAGDEEVTMLYVEPTDAGGDAYAVSADGSVIAGFVFDEGWNTTACYWTNNGTVRHTLPMPTEAQFGGPVDPTYEVRWMSDDARVMLGIVQDNYNGSWVLVYWVRNAAGEYDVHAEYAAQYFTAWGFDESGNGIYYNPERPYTNFEPMALSANGEWATVSLVLQYDLNDWFAEQISKAARLNLRTGQLEVLTLENNRLIDFFGIANNGTAVGSTHVGGVGPMAPGRSKKPSRKVAADMMEESTRVGYIWTAGEDTLHTLQEIFPNEEYFNYAPDNGEATLSTISYDATHIAGFTNKTDGISDWVVSSFVATLPVEYRAIENTVLNSEGTVKALVNGELLILNRGKIYNLLGSHR